MNDMRKLMEASAQLFDDRVQADTDRYYIDQERREQEAEESLPYDIEDAVNYFRTDPNAQRKFQQLYIDNISNEPGEADIDLLMDMIDHYFETVVKQVGLPEHFADSETMDQLVAMHLQDRGYNIDAHDVYRSKG